MKPLLRLAPSLLLACCMACSLTPGDDDDASRLEDFRNRASNYFNSGRYQQAYQQAELGLSIDEDDGGLNLIAGRALLLQRDLMKVAHAYPYLERAQDELDNYKGDYSMAEFHYRYGSMLLEHAREEDTALRKWPREDPKMQAAELKKNDERRETAAGHFADAAALLDDVLEVVPEDNSALEMAGQVAALQGDDARAIGYLGEALDLLLASRQYKNRVLASDTGLTMEDEERLHEDLLNDIRREVAIRFLLAGLHQRSGSTKAEEGEYNNILALDPDSTPAWYSRGMVRYEEGQLAPAVRDLEEFLGRTTLPLESSQVQAALEIVRAHPELATK